MDISENGLNFIKQFEGYRDAAYQDSVGVWTIGYGSTITNGVHVQEGDTCTDDQAMGYLHADVAKFVDGINDLLQTDVNQNQFDAMVSFTYNVGLGNFTNSSLLRKVNEGDFDGAADEFLKWNHAGGRVIEGLTRRREAERALFLS
jgi:lysozyme